MKKKRLQTVSGKAPLWLTVVMWLIVLLFVSPFYILFIYAFKFIY